MPVKAAGRTREEGHPRAGSEEWLAECIECNLPHELMSAFGVTQKTDLSAHLLLRLCLRLRCGIGNFDG